MSENDLPSFCTPISSGLTRVPDSERHRFDLEPECARELQERLDELREWRERSMVAAQFYYIH